jgi:hypothetical protein
VDRVPTGLGVLGDFEGSEPASEVKISLSGWYLSRTEQANVNNGNARGKAQPGLRFRMPAHILREGAGTGAAIPARGLADADPREGVIIAGEEGKCGNRLVRGRAQVKD